LQFLLCGASVSCAYSNDGDDQNGKKENDANDDDDRRHVV
jgi:hypothetical protein